jgi:hypothetical protein
MATGVFTVVHPTEMIVSHPSGRGVLGKEGGAEYLTKRGSQIYGGFSFLVGSLLVGWVCYKPKK